MSKCCGNLARLLQSADDLVKYRDLLDAWMNGEVGDEVLIANIPVPTLLTLISKMQELISNYVWVTALDTPFPVDDEEALAALREKMPVGGLVSAPGDGSIIPAGGERMPRGHIAAYYNVTFGGSDGRRPIFWGETEADEDYVLCDGGSDGEGGIVPDLRGRMIMGASEDHPAGSAGGSETPSLTIGETTLTVAQMPAHHHASWAALLTSCPGNNRGSYADLNNCSVPTTTDGSSAAHAHSISGNVLPPFYALAYVIRIS